MIYPSLHTPARQSRGSLTLVDLPVELVLRIYDFLDITEYLNLALTSREIAYKSHRLLKWHRNLAQKFGTCAPDDPDALYLLVKDIIESETVAWHVRAFENRYDDLKFVSFTHSQDLPPKLARHTGMQLSDVCDRLRPGRYSASRTLLDDARGSSEILKLLLIALCPRLKSVNFRSFPDSLRGHPEVIRWYNLESDNRVMLTIPRDYSEHYFSAAIRYFYLLKPDVPWPQGFVTLQRLTISDDGPNRTAIKDILPLLRLPNLLSLRARGLRVGNNSLESIVRNCKSMRRKHGPRLEHLYIDRPNWDYAAGGDEAVLECVMAFIYMFWYLRTLVLDDAEHLDLDKLTHFLSRNHTSTLETWITIPGTDPNMMNRFFYVDRHMYELWNFGTLRTLVLDVICWGIKPEETAYDTFSSYSQRSFPPGLKALEVLVLDSSAKPLRWGGAQMAQFADLLKEMLEGNWCPRLKAIYMDKVTDAWLEPRTSERSDAALRGLMKVAEKHHVTIHGGGGSGKGASDRYLSGICAELFAA